MSDWEFLLQKEGDRSWLPLESPDVEILEGRYRIVARSKFPEAEVQIRVLHESTEEDPPVRRVQTRAGRTNKEGLIALVPYTNLKPGLWEITCEPASMSGILPEANPQAIHLQVLPLESDAIDFTHFPEESETAEESETEAPNFPQIPDEARERLPKVQNQRVSIPKDIPPKPLIKPLEKTEQRPAALGATAPSLETEQLSETEANYIEPQLEITKPSLETEQLSETEANYIEPQVEITEPILEQKQPSEVNDIETENPTETFVPPVNWQLILERDSYIAKLGEIMILSGTITSDAVENIAPLVDGSLHICLRNPETSEILAEIEEPLPEQIPPIIFGCTIAIPEKVKTRLVLGQIALADSTGTIASQSFTITAPLEQWLEALDRNFSEDEHQALPEETTRKQQTVEFPPFINVGGAIASPTSAKPEPAKPSQSSEWGEISAPELPAFGNSMPETMSPGGLNLMELLAQKRPSVESTEPTEATEATTELGDETEVESLADDLWGGQEEADGESQAEVATDVTDKEDIEETIQESQELQSDRQSSPMIKGFQSAKHDDRFLSRLNSLVGDSDLLEWMKIDSTEPVAEKIQTNSALDEVSTKQIESQIDWEAMEVVVDEEPLPPPMLPGAAGRLTGGNFRRLPGQGELAPISDALDLEDSTSGYILPPDEPVPTPVVEVLAREVVAGRRVKVRVQLPDLLPRIYVKLWISDRQTQTIVDHPRWVTDFSLNGFDKLEATVEMEVPYGCLEVRFEAIAREMPTNRESHKASIDRLVVPPPPPSLPLEGK